MASGELRRREEGTVTWFSTEDWVARAQSGDAEPRRCLEQAEQAAVRAEQSAGLAEAWLVFGARGDAQRCATGAVTLADGKKEVCCRAATVLGSVGDRAGAVAVLDGVEDGLRRSEEPLGRAWLVLAEARHAIGGDIAAVTRCVQTAESLWTTAGWRLGWRSAAPG